MAILRISSLRRSCLVDVDVSCSGFMKVRFMRYLGPLPMANSIWVLPLRVTCVFLTVAAFRINWAGVICAREVWSRFLEAVSTSVERNFVVHPSQLDWAKECAGPLGIFEYCAFE